MRRFCGWHVTPVLSTTLTLRGSGHHFIALPTLKIDTITSITECGVALDLTTIDQFDDEPGVLYKQYTHGYEYGYFHPHGTWRGKVVITLTHGYAAAEAMAFREEVLALIDRSSMTIGSGGWGTPTEIKVDDVNTRWDEAPARILGAVSKNPLDASVLYQYRLLPIG